MSTSTAPNKEKKGGIKHYILGLRSLWLKSKILE